MTKPNRIPDFEERELEIVVRQRLNEAVTGALILISLFAITVCGLITLSLWR